jgi:DisA bacterial checkpoint controller nucleotide-binding
VTGIDGAVLVDPSGFCHGIGVILDGTATSVGDRARGARYNSALKYLASWQDTPTVILIVSEDGMIDLHPDLPPRIRRADREAWLKELREAAKIKPVDGERFYKAYRRVGANAFYFSPEQIDEINHLMDDHWERRITEGRSIRMFEPIAVPP